MQVLHNSRAPMTISVSVICSASLSAMNGSALGSSGLFINGYMIECHICKTLSFFSRPSDSVWNFLNVSFLHHNLCKENTMTSLRLFIISRVPKKQRKGIASWADSLLVFFLWNNTILKHFYAVKYETWTSQIPRWVEPAAMAMCLPAMSFGSSHLTISGPLFFMSLIRPHKSRSTHSWGLFMICLSNQNILSDIAGTYSVDIKLLLLDEWYQNKNTFVPTMNEDHWLLNPQTRMWSIW